MSNKLNYIEGDEEAEDFDNNPSDWVRVSDEKQAEFRGKLSKNKEKRVSLRMSADVIEKIKEKAMQSGLGYQTYISMVLFKNVHDEDELVKLKKRVESLEKKINEKKSA